MAARSTSVFEPKTFARLLARAKTGDEEAFAALYRAYQPRVLRFLRARVGQVGEDLASEVWMTVARGLKGFEGDEAGFRGWLFTSARHRVIDHARKRHARPAETGEEPPEIAVTDPSRLEADEAVAALIRGLSDVQAEIVLLRVLGNFSAREVARMLGMTEEAVRVAQHRALQRLAHAQLGTAVSHSDEQVR